MSAQSSAEHAQMKERPDTARKDDGSPTQQKQRPTFENPLPGGEEIWKDSPLDYPDRWSDALQAYSLTLSSFAYPAAIFWGEEFVLLHNEQWSTVGGVQEQGQRQRGRFDADVFSGLSAALHGGKPKRVSSKALLRSDKAEVYTVMVSPLFDDQNKSKGAHGLLAQLMPKEEHQRGAQGKKPDPDGREKSEDQESDLFKLGKPIDNVPLDEHPFFHRFAEMLPSGLAILDQKAQAVFVNQHFYELTTHRGDDQSFKSWPQSIHSDDYERVMNAYHKAFTSQKQLRTEFRAEGMEQPWRLLLLTPLGDENLQHVSLREYGGFICSIVDISSEKNAELTQRKAAKEARERKEQQERFIDMISHEIRNPLSAVMHCSDDIEEAVRDRGKVDFPAIKEAVETINLCISHQRNIVDDVLSFSKLDASMLSLAPKSAKPSEQLAESMKMFQPEFRKQGIEFGYEIDKSYKDYQIDWVMADLARIGQVLINLVSNAIKFTARSQGEKKLVVSVAASDVRPTSFPPSVVFFTPEETTHRLDATNTPEWGFGEPMYIMAAVKDSGIGISENGQKRLFERFRQATPKTGEIYGGSGLGLNISRKLCHLHGGEIGVSSEEGKGSTFGFFFKARRSEAPGDYEGRPEDESMAEDQLRSQIKQLGNAPSDQTESSTTPESLKELPVSSLTDSTPQHSVENDSRFQTSQGIMNQVQKEGRHEDRQHSVDGMDPRHKHDREKHPRNADATPQGPTHEQEDSSLEQPGAYPSSQRTRPHVLLVEDNAINQRIMYRKLGSKGFNVTTANNGQEAVDAVRKAPKPSTGDKGAFDVVLMDQEMPIMDGNTATKEIRKLEAKGEIERVPILGVTANVRGAQQDEMVSSGMDGVISKPFKIEDMVQKINETIGAPP